MAVKPFAAKARHALTQAAVERSAGQRIKLERVAFLELTSANGEIYEAQARWTAQIAQLQQQAQAELQQKQSAFHALLTAHAKTAGVDPARIQRWDKETCELIVDGED